MITKGMITNTKISIGFSPFRGGAKKTNGKFYKQQQYLQTLATSIYLPSAYARSLLLKYDIEYEYIEPVIFPTISSARLQATQDNRDSKESFIKIYPNPAYDYISVDYKLEDGNGRIDIVDNMGRFILSKQLQNQEGIEVLGLDNLSSGIYKLLLYSNNKLIETKQFNKIK